MDNFTPEKLAAYALLGTLACTALDKIVDALRPIAAATASKRDDQALDFIDAALGKVQSVLSYFSIRAKK